MNFRSKNTGKWVSSIGLVQWSKNRSFGLVFIIVIRSWRLVVLADLEMGS